MSGLDFSAVDAAVASLGGTGPATIPLLQAVQRAYGYLPEEALARLAELTEISRERFEEVGRFFPMFRFRPSGEHTIRVCVGTACHVRGAAEVVEGFRRHLEIAEGEDTDAERRYTVQEVACLGCCTLAVAVQVGGVVFGHVRGEEAGRVLRDYERLLEEGGDGMALGGEVPAEGAIGEVRTSTDTCCLARGGGGVLGALRTEVDRLGEPVTVRTVGCWGMNWLEPMVEVLDAGGGRWLYTNVGAEDVRGLLGRHFRPGSVLRRLAGAVSRGLDVLVSDENWSDGSELSMERQDPGAGSFTDCQCRIVTEGVSQREPTDLQAWREAGCYKALAGALAEGRPGAVVEAICSSGLRGRGGAGFPTGQKWSHVCEAEGSRKYVVCNGDEGDPGAFMDRMLLEGCPYRVLEGMTLAGWAVGAGEGVVYVRAEYPLAVSRMREAMERAEAAGLLGEDILCSGWGFRVRLFEGAGRFVCGEETALLASLDGRVGKPVRRPPYPSEAGLGGFPTLIQNVETLANVGWILRRGPGALRALGTERSAGTKVFALAGKVRRGGLIEVPMGTTIRQVVDEAGGGVPGEAGFKAVQIGGPSGGCIPAELADTPIDYEALGELGAMMGSGGLVVLDGTDCMVDIARYFLAFTHRESCGKCRWCKAGSKELLDLLEGLCAGRGQFGDLGRIEELCERIPRGSLCGLGRTAANPVATTLRYFRGEYEAHLAGRCPAGLCRELLSYEITADCIGCTRCAQRCPADAIAARPHERHEIDQESCVRCGTCLRVCPADAVRLRQTD